MDFPFIAYRNMIEGSTDRKTLLEAVTKVIDMAKQEIDNVSAKQIEAYKNVQQFFE